MRTQDKVYVEKILAGCDKDDCLKIIALVWRRIEYLERREELKKSGFSEN